jgi:hypothetical protein
MVALMEQAGRRLAGATDLVSRPCDRFGQIKLQVGWAVMMGVMFPSRFRSNGCHLVVVGGSTLQDVLIDTYTLGEL